MGDIEKVVSHLYDCLMSTRTENTWVFVRKDIIGDAIAILKEQEAEKKCCRDCEYYGACHDE